MKTFIAIIMGFFAGLLLYFMAALLLADPATGKQPSAALVAIIFFGSCIGFAWAIRRGAEKLSKVFSRGFLILSAEWLAMIAVGVIWSGKATISASAAAGGSGAATAGAAVGGGLVAMITGGVSFFMLLVCLAGFAISYFMGREMAPETTPVRAR